MVFGTIRSILVGAGLLGVLACADMAWGQSQLSGDPFSPITAEERSAAEMAALGDQRVTEIVGRGQLRVASSDVIVEKGEAERFIEGHSGKRPTRQVVVAVLNVETNKAARALVLLSHRISVIAVERIASADVPLVRADAEQALALAKASYALRSALGKTLDQFRILEPGSEERIPFAAQVLPLRNSDPSDACSVDRCLSLIFRTESGYLELRADVDLTRRTVVVEQEEGRPQ